MVPELRDFLMVDLGFNVALVGGLDLDASWVACDHAWFVRLNGSTETFSVGNVVDNAVSAGDGVLDGV